MQPRPRGSELAEQAGRVVAKVRDPRARALRQRRRARRATVVRSGVTLVGAAVTAVIGSTGALELSEVLAGAFTVAVGLRAVTAGARWARLRRTPLPPAAAPPLPPRDSAAHEPLARLADAEAALDDLLAVLARPRAGVAVVAPETLDSTRAAVAEAAAGLRGTADALRAVERVARERRDELTGAVAALRRDLDRGVDEVWDLVTAVGEVVTAAGPQQRPGALTEATDRLAGLARGLRDLADPATP